MAINHVLSRRALLGLLPLPFAASCVFNASNRSGWQWASATGTDHEKGSVSCIKKTGTASQLKTGFRGHEVLAHPYEPERVIVIARRPGRFLVELDFAASRVVRRIECERSLHHNGHACLTADGAFLISAESQEKTGEGRLVVRDTKSYRTQAVFSGPGIGPHAIALLPDEKTLVVAVGGLNSDAQNGQLLNGKTMRSFLALVDVESGELLDEHALSESKASLRHLDVSPSGAVAVGVQMQREVATHDLPVPLCALYRPDEGLHPLVVPDSLLVQLNDYVGSVCIASSVDAVAFSSPRGNIALFVSLRDGKLLGYHRFHDVCGLSTTIEEDAFVLSNTRGEVRFIDSTTFEERKDERLVFSDYAFDNHLLRLPSHAKEESST